MTYAKIRADLGYLNRLMTTQAHLLTNFVVSQAYIEVGPRHSECTPASKIWDFMRINPHTSHGTKVDEDLQGFIN